MLLTGRVAIVTGSGGGNGRAIAERFALEGARVVCADLDGAAAAEAAAAVRAAGGESIDVTMDHTSEHDCQRTVVETAAAFGPPDVLVNNAGVAILGTALDVSAGDFLRQLRVNLLGPFLMTRAALPGMIERQRGAIVMIASAAGLYARQAGAGYVSSKHGLIGLTRSLAVDYGPYGIRVNAVCPGVIRTRMSQEYLEDRARREGTSVDAVVEGLARQYPLGRIGEPEDVAAAALHFASDQSSWVTGEAYLLDGGQSLFGPRPPLPTTPPGAST
jgi:NAD(P)-dependent dehydrogenase (short-subunit alcohol dehydrogenase family)